LTWKALCNMNNVPPLLHAFVRDGSIFFALASISSFLGFIAPFVAHGPVEGAFLPWSMALYSYSGAHLILDLRAAGTQENADSTWHRTLSLQDGPGEFYHSARFTSIPHTWE